MKWLSLLTKLVVVAVITAFSVAACAQSRFVSAANTHPVPTPVDAAAALPVQVIALPTRADGKPEPTQLQASVGEMSRFGRTSEIQQTPKLGNYQALAETPTDLAANKVTARIANSRFVADNWTAANGYRVLQVKDTVSNTTQLLGDVFGSSTYWTANDDYLIWSYRCHDCSQTQRTHDGLYAHRFSDGSEILLDSGVYSGYAKIDGTTVAYIRAKSGSRTIGELHAFNLDAGNDHLVSANAIYQRLPDRDLFAIGGGRIVWLETETSSKPLLKTFSLSNNDIASVSAPNLVKPSSLSMSGNALVWFDQAWFVFNFKSNSLFVFEPAVPGWDNIQSRLSGSVVVKDDSLYWAREVRGKVYHFTTPILP